MHSSAKSTICLICLLVAAACGGERASPVARALERASEGVLVLPDDLAGPSVLLDGATLPPEAWRPVFRIGEQHSDAELADFGARSRVIAEGRVELGTERGSLMTSVAVEGGVALLVEAEVQVFGLDPVRFPGRARLGVVEFASAAPPADLAAVGALVKGGKWSEELVRPTPQPVRVSLLFRTAPETRSLGVFCSFSRAPELPEAHAVFSDVRVSRPGELELAAALAADPEGPLDGSRPARAAYSIEHMRRPGLALVPGARASVPVSVPSDAPVLETWIGLAPSEFWTPGARVELVCSWSRTRDGAPVERLRNTLQAGPDGGAAWVRLRTSLPEEAAGSESWLHFSAGAPVSAGDGAPRPRALAVFGNPRFVPAHVERPGPNVVLVSLDTLRADHVGCYGYARPTTPHVDELAREALVFEDTWAPAPYTLPAHVSLLSGQLPSVHGVQAPRDRVDPQRTRLLAEILAARGYATGAFTGGGLVLPEFGFGRGFDCYGSLDPGANLESERLARAVATIPGLSLDLLRRSSADAVRAWVEHHANEPFFLFLHTYAAHEFDPPQRHLQELGLRGLALVRQEPLMAYLANKEPPPPEARAHLVDFYDGGVRHADELVGALVDELRSLDLLQDTLFVITSDHGKELGEHGMVGHGHTLYEECLRVPLIVRVPGRAPGRVTGPASLVDVVPTVLEVLDLPFGGAMQGTSLLALAAGRAGDRPLWAEVDNMAVKQALRHGAHKTIFGPLGRDVPFPSQREEETYDLAADPGELAPLAPDAARLVPVIEHGRALAELGTALAGDVTSGQALSAAARAQIEALGYTLGDED